MEQDTAILIADLSGYTALTETHGSWSAADLIDKYLELVNASLAGNCLLHEVVGDEVMILSASADDLLATANVLMQRILKEPNFLQIHGGLHFGKLLKRGNSYFGAALNLASRIASKANPGSFWCSSDFIQELSAPPVCTFRSMGTVSFKNVTAEKEVFEIVRENPATFYIDPVCRMVVSKETNSLSHPQVAELLFCSQDCLDIYLKSSKY